ncbi:DUF1365 domain-containing protein [Massilia sp. W12]|uniref:DUF1365 domain-containing protein n=1 Tax=Massilia sp. W12 TaxID=3126507 RepID=UPI0030D26392
MEQPAAYLLSARVMHERRRPAVHRFAYRVFCLRVNLRKLDACQNALFGIDKARIISLRQKDYGARDGSPLLPWIEQLLRSHGIAADGDIWLQTFPRIFGFAFNPVSFWYCHGADGALLAVLAEVNNTFGEHHFYLMHQAGGAMTHEQMPVCEKKMHVSPFCEIRGAYRFRFVETQSHAAVNIHYHDQPARSDLPALLHATLCARKQALNWRNLARALLAQPWQALAVVVQIHWQALLLWRKRTPFFSHQPKADSWITVEENIK